jgi:hypothetical protein
MRGALDVAEILEVVDDFAHRLLGEAGAVGQVGEPRALRVDEPEHAPVRLPDRRVALVAEASVQLLDHEVSGLIE